MICVNWINLVKKTLTLMGNSSGTDVFVINVTSPDSRFHSLLESDRFVWRIDR